jgi:triacylglycerol lipase
MQGTYLGTLENVSHLDLIGWTNTARYAWAEAMGRAISFKPATFYLGVVDHLARVVEGGEEAAPSSPQAARELDRKTGEGVQVVDGQGKGQTGRAEPKRAMSGDAQTPEEQGAETTARRSVDAGATRRRTGPGKKGTDNL